MIENEYKKEGQVKQFVKKLWSGNADAYLKWKMQLDHAFKNLPYESDKAKIDMEETMLDGDLLESWKLWCKTESKNEKEDTFKKEATREVERNM